MQRGFFQSGEIIKRRSGKHRAPFEFFSAAKRSFRIGFVVRNNVVGKVIAVIRRIMREDPDRGGSAIGINKINLNGGRPVVDDPEWLSVVDTERFVLLVGGVCGASGNVVIGMAIVAFAGGATNTQPSKIVRGND